MSKDKWLLRGVIIALISAIAAFFVQHYGEFIMNNIGNLLKNFLITFSPLIIGLFVFFVYWIITDHIRLRHVIAWIGFFSYPDHKKGGYLYADLKGKIKQYIREELEKEKLIWINSKWDELDKLKGLAYEKALEKLTNGERNEYLDYESNKAARKAAYQFLKKDE